MFGEMRNYNFSDKFYKHLENIGIKSKIPCHLVNSLVNQSVVEHIVEIM